jgi:hypothetical protein
MFILLYVYLYLDSTMYLWSSVNTFAASYLNTQG